ncbi:hypothetical protein ELE36_12150 [Pseudolysobacter antarcticus]|uniref:Transposase DDE domain-containing protein n=1 Tax=Pseudolysobacter antarcticus TaxID=2511995 RepID=A0A411HKL7_9GAMM|nr:hypothetical protein ELE36_12150 [Pseudolysobacter antarcticus]
MSTQAPPHVGWGGRRVRLVDGTTLPMPDTPANQAAYPQPRSQQPGLGFPLCRLVALTCLSSGAVLDAGVGRYLGKGGDEQSLLRPMLERLDAGDIATNRTPTRPGRIEPRAIKRRPKPRKLLTVPRNVARAQIRKERTWT